MSETTRGLDHEKWPRMLKVELPLSEELSFERRLALLTGRETIRGAPLQAICAALVQAGG